MPETVRLRQLEEENRRLKRLVADQALDIQVLKEVLGKTDRARQASSGRTPCHCVARLFRTVGLSSGRDQPADNRHRLAPDPSANLRVRLRAVAEERRRFGTRLCILLSREGWPVNHKRVERIYREEKLSLRLKRRRKRTSHLRVVAPGPTGPNQQWAMDFMSDSLENGRRFRVLTIVDLWDRRCPNLDADHSLAGERVARMLERLRARGECPGVIRTDNGPEFTGKALDRWAQAAGVKLEFIRPGKPTDNGHVESFNGRFREECLDAQMFSSLDEVRMVIEAWRQDYNTDRPHSSLGGLSPEEYRRAWSRETNQARVRTFGWHTRRGKVRISTSIVLLPK